MNDNQNPIEVRGSVRWISEGLEGSDRFSGPPPYVCRRMEDAVPGLNRGDVSGLLLAGGISPRDLGRRRQAGVQETEAGPVFVTFGPAEPAGPAGPPLVVLEWDSPRGRDEPFAPRWFDLDHQIAEKIGDPNVTRVGVLLDELFLVDPDADNYTLCLRLRGGGTVRVSIDRRP